MAEICVAGKRCDPCPLNQIPIEEQFPLFVDKIVGADGEMKLPPGELGCNFTAQDVEMGIQRRMQLKTEIGTQVKLLRLTGLCTSQ